MRPSSCFARALQARQAQLGGTAAAIRAVALVDSVKLRQQMDDAGLPSRVHKIHPVLIRGADRC